MASGSNRQRPLPLLQLRPEPSSRTALRGDAAAKGQEKGKVLDEPW
jgi:hypothetical protein